MRAIHGYMGEFVTRCALQLAVLTFVRPGELRYAEWSEFDLDAAQWRIPGLDYPPSSAARQPNLVASNPSDIGKPGFLMMQTKVDFDQIWQCKEATR